MNAIATKTTATGRTKNIARPALRNAPFRIKNILVPIDLSPASGRAVIAGQALAKWTGARLVLLHVVDKIHNLKDFGYGPVDWDAEDIPGLVRGHRKMSGLQCRVAKQCVHCRAHVRSGDAATEIARAALALDSDLIVMATTHLAEGGMAASRTASVAEMVFRRAQKPVLLLPPSRRANDEK